MTLHGLGAKRFRQYFITPLEAERENFKSRLFSPGFFFFSLSLLFCLENLHLQMYNSFLNTLNIFFRFFLIIVEFLVSIVHPSFSIKVNSNQKKESAHGDTKPSNAVHDDMEVTDQNHHESHFGVTMDSGGGFEPDQGNESVIEVIKGTVKKFLLKHFIVTSSITLVTFGDSFLPL